MHARVEQISTIYKLQTMGARFLIVRERSEERGKARVNPGVLNWSCRYQVELIFI